MVCSAGGENIAPVPMEDNIKKLHQGISNIMMVGDKRKYNVALVTLKVSYHCAFLRRQSVPFLPVPRPAAPNDVLAQPLRFQCFRVQFKVQFRSSSLYPKFSSVQFMRAPGVFGLYFIGYYFLSSIAIIKVLFSFMRALFSINPSTWRNRTIQYRLKDSWGSHVSTRAHLRVLCFSCPLRRPLVPPEKMQERMSWTATPRRSARVPRPSRTLAKTKRGWRASRRLSPASKTPPPPFFFLFFFGLVGGGEARTIPRDASTVSAMLHWRQLHLLRVAVAVFALQWL